MIAAIGASLLLIVAGWPFARESSLASRIGEAFLLGSGLAAAILFVDSVLGIAWSRATTVVPLLAIAVAASVIARRTLLPMRPHFGLANLIDVFTIILGVGYAGFATVGPSPENDFVEIWGLKAREFAAAHAIDWHFLEQPFNRFAHVDYPILLPLLFDFHDIVGGGWPERWLGVVNVCFGGATLLLLRGFLNDEPSTVLWRALATVAFFSTAVSPWLGLAECAMVAYGTAALLFVRRGIVRGVNADVMRGALFLGLAANSKNEGVSLIAAVACALVIAGAWRSLAALWPAVVVTAPWQLVRFLHHLQTDLMTAGLTERAWQHATNLMPILSAIAHDSVGRPLFWIGVASALLIGVRDVFQRERFLFGALLAQLLFFIAAYIVTPHDVAWHVRWSWERLASQLTPGVAFLAIALMLRLSRAGEAG